MTEAEPRVQPKFMIASVALLFAAIVGVHDRLLTLPSRAEHGSAISLLRVEPAEPGIAVRAPLLAAGAWRLSSPDHRFAGLSALAVERGGLLAISDSGVVARLDLRPGRQARVALNELPGGPGSPLFKSNRDAEAIAADPGGRGWWVAFENRDELWLYDHNFSQVRSRFSVPQLGLARNTGIEGLAAGPGTLFLFPESGERLVLVGGQTATVRITVPRRLADAVRLEDGTFLVLQRRLTPLGFRNRLARLAILDDQVAELWSMPLGVRWFDNMEGLALAKRGNGYRLYLISDSGLRPKVGTLLLVVDVPEALTKAA